MVDRPTSSILHRPAGKHPVAQTRTSWRLHGTTSGATGVKSGNPTSGWKSFQRLEIFPACGGISFDRLEILPLETTHSRWKSFHLGWKSNHPEWNSDQCGWKSNHPGWKSNHKKEPQQKDWAPSEMTYHNRLLWSLYEVKHKYLWHMFHQRVSGNIKAVKSSVLCSGGWISYHKE